MTTFEQARQIVAAHRAEEYPAGADFQVAPWGYENDEVWVVLSGSWPEIYGPRDENDRDYISREDGPRTLVNKTTGEYIEQWGAELDEEPPNLTPVGQPGPPPE